MSDRDSSGGKDPVKFHFDCWCVRCGHVVHTKFHAARHFKRCPPPHTFTPCNVAAGQLSIIGVSQFLRHFNARGICKRLQLHWKPPQPVHPRYNVSCTRPWQLLPILSAASAASTAAAVSTASAALNVRQHRPQRFPAHRVYLLCQLAHASRLSRSTTPPLRLHSIRRPSLSRNFRTF